MFCVSVHCMPRLSPCHSQKTKESLQQRKKKVLSEISVVDLIYRNFAILFLIFQATAFFYSSTTETMGRSTRAAAQAQMRGKQVGGGSTDNFDYVI